MREMEFAFQIQRPLVLAIGTSGVGPQEYNAGDMINWQLAAFAHHDMQKPWRRRLATLIEVRPDADFVQ